MKLNELFLVTATIKGLLDKNPKQFFDAVISLSMNLENSYVNSFMAFTSSPHGTVLFFQEQLYRSLCRMANLGDQQILMFDEDLNIMKGEPRVGQLAWVLPEGGSLKEVTEEVENTFHVFQKEIDMWKNYRS